MRGARSAPRSHPDCSPTPLAPGINLKPCPDSARKEKLARALGVLEGHPEEGLAELDDLVRKYPKDAGLRAVTGMAHLAEGEAWEALPHLEWAVGRDPHPDWLEGLEEAYEELEMPLHAAQVARRRGSTEEDLLEHLPRAPEGMPRKQQLEYERARAEVLHFQPAGLPRLEPVAQKYPDYLDAANLLATAYYLKGDMANFHRAARAAIQRWPRDAHALLNAVRSGLLADGWDGAREWAGHLPAAEGVDLADTLITRASVATYLNDFEALDAALREYFEQTELDPNDARVDHLTDLALQRSIDPQAPLLSLERALLPVLGAMMAPGADGDPRTLKRYLAAAPGLLDILHDLLGYGEVTLAQMVAIALLGEEPPLSPGAPWHEVIARIARQGPGWLAVRAGLMTLLVEEGILPPEEGLEFPGPPGEEERRVTLLFGPEPTGLPAAAEERFQEAVDKLDAGEPAAAKRARERTQGLLSRHPHLLLARATEALDALAEMDLERAEQVLTLPPGELVVNFRHYAMFLGVRANLAFAREDVALAEDLLMALADVVGEQHEIVRALVEELGLDPFGDGSAWNDEE